MLQKKWLVIAVIAVLLTSICLVAGKASKAMNREKETEDPILEENQSEVRSSLPDGYVIVYSTPPNYVMLGGELRQARVKVDLDLAEYRVGKIDSYIDEVYRRTIKGPDGGHDGWTMTPKLPEKEGETNFAPYLNCDYAYYSGEWYLLFNQQWYRLDGDCEKSMLLPLVMINGDLYIADVLISEGDYSAYRAGTISSYIEREKNLPPMENNQTNYIDYLNRDYAFFEGDWYLNTIDENDGHAWRKLRLFDLSCLPEEDYTLKIEQ